MNVWPLRFREIEGGPVVFTDDTGAFFAGDGRFLDRYALGCLSEADIAFLEQHGHAFRDRDDLAYTSFAYRWSLRQARPTTLSYVILIPTLRCNLSCTYCQVARADERAAGFDWTADTISGSIAFLDGLDTEEIKIEFQGGEPLLRLDLLDKVREHCRKRFARASFVVCTNLQRLSASHWDFLEADDTYVSTSLDGDRTAHQGQRTQDEELTNEFFANLEEALRRLGPEKISALPTIDINSPPSPATLVDAYVRYGFRSIYLRPVNYQGFARKNPSGVERIKAWNAYHSAFIDHLVAHNANNEDFVEEYYFTHCLRRIFQAGLDGDTDLRNPSPVAADCIVIDFDGKLYPSDEARMLARVNQVDLSIGDVSSGIDPARTSHLNANALNSFDPDCIHCPYQPYCGVDFIDDLSRYGRVDLPRHETWFCSRQTAIFDKAFAMLYSGEPAVQAAVTGWLGIASIPPGLRVRLP